ncbi:MAG: FxsA family protein [Deltaproteobacteria bacterium]|nr:FxsA family protein [Deltaproteobacteria bacterium]
MAKLVLLFTIVPALELYLLFQLSELLGFAETFLIVIATGVLGAALAKQEGLRLLTQWHEATLAGRMPEEGVISGALLLVGGVLLVTPGVMTDFLGLLLLFSQTRLAIAALVRRAIDKKIRSGEIFVNMQGGGFETGPSPFEQMMRDQMSQDSRNEPMTGEYVEEGEVLDGNIEIIEDDTRDDSPRNR